MQVEADAFILSLASTSDTEDDRHATIHNEEPNSLPAELENADMSELVCMSHASHANIVHTKDIFIISSNIINSFTISSIHMISNTSILIRMSIIFIYILYHYIFLFIASID
mgnify:CR=1 FL=1